MDNLKFTYSQPSTEEWQHALSEFQQRATQWLRDLDNHPVAALKTTLSQSGLPAQGAGSEVTIDKVHTELVPQMSASRGPRYWGFVTGGATPIATYGDWLVSLLDQNVSKYGDSIASKVEHQAIQWLVELFELPSSFTGLCTTGATASNFLAAITARQFAGTQQGIDIAKQGMAGLDIEIFSACPHASMIKTLGLAGFGQNNISRVETVQDSEAMDPEDLARKLEQSRAKSKIVISSAATVTGTSFDDLPRIAALCRQHRAWLHVDAAFGIFARLLTNMVEHSAGIEHADSITLDGHKWLNVPYDCGMFLTRHQNLLKDSCHVAAPYLVQSENEPDFMSLGVENSRRFRALPVWMTLYAYGKSGIRTWVEKNCRQAQTLAQFIDASTQWKLVYPCGLNVVLFRPSKDNIDCDSVLQHINARGKVFLSPGKWQGQAIIRAAFSNWQTEDSDVAIAIRELQTIAADF